MSGIKNCITFSSGNALMLSDRLSNVVEKKIFLVFYSIYIYREREREAENDL